MISELPYLNYCFSVVFSFIFSKKNMFLILLTVQKQTIKLIQLFKISFHFQLNHHLQDFYLKQVLSNQT